MEPQPDDESSFAGDQLWRDLAVTEPMVAKSMELHGWYTALCDSGFDQQQAFILLPALLMNGFIRREQA